MFFMFFKLYKWCQIAQSITHVMIYIKAFCQVFHKKLILQAALLGAHRQNAVFVRRSYDIGDLISEFCLCSF